MEFAVAAGRTGRSSSCFLISKTLLILNLVLFVHFALYAQSY